MSDSVELLSQALDQGHVRPEPLGPLLDLGDDLAAWLAAPRLSRAERERLRARSVALAARWSPRPAWLPRIHVPAAPKAALVGGATALAVGGAAVLGWALVRGHRQPMHPLGLRRLRGHAVP